MSLPGAPRVLLERSGEGRCIAFLPLSATGMVRRRGDPRPLQAQLRRGAARVVPGAIRCPLGPRDVLNARAGELRVVVRPVRARLRPVQSRRRFGAPALAAVSVAFTALGFFGALAWAGPRLDAPEPELPRLVRWLQPRPLPAPICAASSVVPIPAVDPKASSPDGIFATTAVTTDCFGKAQ